MSHYASHYHYGSQSIAFSGQWECRTGWSQPVNCINIEGHIALLSESTHLVKHIKAEYMEGMYWIFALFAKILVRILCSTLWKLKWVLDPNEIYGEKKGYKQAVGKITLLFFVDLYPLLNKSRPTIKSSCRLRLYKYKDESKADHWWCMD